MEQSKSDFDRPNIVRGIVLVAIIAIFGLLFFKIDIDIQPRFGAGSLPEAGGNDDNDLALEKAVLPEEGIILPVSWGELGQKLVEFGVIDLEKLTAIYQRRGGLSAYEKSLVYTANNEEIKMNSENAGFVLNLLWALGLANKNKILEEGPMTDEAYGGADSFASTAGWTLAKGGVMDHYSRHHLVVLSKQQQDLVERVSKNIYRPCCGNPAYFPDCNHGMAMLGLLELLASRGLSEKEMYKIALQANSYWFPETYLTIAKYFKKRGVNWDELDPKEILGSLYSSARGYQRILGEVEPFRNRGGGSCGV
jgi:hypothetical protein